jgi:quinol monooxygenase YgiN
VGNRDEEAYAVGFVQIIEIKTSKIDQIQQLDKEWQAATEGKRTATRALVTKDRDRPDTYLVIVEFPSYEAAQANNSLPETGSFAEKIGALADDQKFLNLDVIDENKL